MAQFGGLRTKVLGYLKGNNISKNQGIFFAHLPMPIFLGWIQFSLLYSPTHGLSNGPNFGTSIEKWNKETKLPFNSAYHRDSIGKDKNNIGQIGKKTSILGPSFCNGFTKWILILQMSFKPSSSGYKCRLLFQKVLSKSFKMLIFISVGIIWANLKTSKNYLKLH